MKVTWQVKVLDPRHVATGEWREVLKPFDYGGEQKPTFDAVADALDIDRFELDRINREAWICEDGDDDVSIPKLKLYLAGMEDAAIRLIEQGLLKQVGDD